MFPDNLIKQQEEVEALTSIYEDDWIVEGETTYNIKIKENGNEAVLNVTMPPEYPSQAPPKFELSAPWMSRKDKNQVYQALNEVYLDNIGEMVIYQWVEKVRNFMFTKPPADTPKTKPKAKGKRSPPKTDVEEEINCPRITHGEVITDRKSSFQGHAAEVRSVEEVNAVLSKLKQNKKISHATHNMFAYRIEQKTRKGSPMILQDCDDDGENHAGGRMMKLLEILDQKNTLVVVSRWKGGIQLGPDRFRHINNVARQAIDQAGLLKRK